MSNNQKVDYLDCDKKGWCNNSGYGNIVITQVSCNTKRSTNSLVAPWDRIQPMNTPYSVGVNPHAWSPELSKENKAILDKTCCSCMGICYCDNK